MNFLIDKKNSLINRYCATRSEREKYNLGLMISCIDQAMEYISHSPHKDDDDDYSLLQSIFDDVDYLNLARPFLGDVTDFFQRLYYLIPREPSKFQTINTSKSSILKVSRDFFLDVRQSLGDRLVTSERNGNLRVRIETKRHNLAFEGQSFPIYGTGMALISSNLNGNIGDYFIGSIMSS